MLLFWRALFGWNIHLHCSMQKLLSCGTWALVLWSGIKLGPPPLGVWVLVTGPPGKFLCSYNTLLIKPNSYFLNHSFIDIWDFPCARSSINTHVPRNIRRLSALRSMMFINYCIQKAFVLKLANILISNYLWSVHSVLKK